MDRKIQNIVNKVLSEKISGERKRRLFENKKMCTECGKGSMVEGMCSECGYMGEDMCTECGKGGMVEGMCSECGYTEGEFKESKKLSKGQQYIAKQAKPYNKIGANDFAKLRSKKSEVKEKLYGRQHVLDKNKNNKIDYEDLRMVRNESIYGISLEGKQFLFNENEMINIIENIILEEKKKKKSSKLPSVTKKSLDKSKGENDDYVKGVIKKMKDYLKKGSKADYDMYPKTFPKGNGELAKMSKMAYIKSDTAQEYIDNFTAAGLENLEYDEIHPNDEWVRDNVVGSSRTGNNPEWANAVKTDVGDRRNKIRKNNLLAKVKRDAYQKDDQPIRFDRSGEDLGDTVDTLMKKYGSKKSGKKKVSESKLNEDVEDIFRIINYNNKTQ
jgi:hypothetical protein